MCIACSLPLIDGGTSHLPVTILRLTLIAILTFWVIACVRRGRIRIRRSSLDVPIFFFFAIAVFSTFRSPYVHMSLQWLGTLLSYAVFFFLVLHTIDNRRRLDRVVYAVVAIGCVEALLGTVQSILLESARATGTFFNPNFLAGYLAAISAVALGCLTAPQSTLRTRITWAALCLLMVHAILLTGSRGGGVALLVSISCVLWLRFGKTAIAYVLAVVLFLAIIPNPLQQRVLSEHEHNPYTYSRMAIWSSSVSRAWDNPLGTGLGMYKYTSQQYPVEVDGVLSRYGTRAQTAHNEYLHIAVELGVFGLLVLCWGIAKMAQVAHGVLASDREANERSIAIGLTGGVLGMLTQAAVDSSFHQPPIVLLLILFGALLLNMQLQRGPRHWMLEFAVRPTKLTVCGIYILAVLVSIVAIRPAFAWYAWVDAQRLLLAKDVEGAHARLDWAVFLAPGNATYHDAHAEAAFQQLRVSGEWAWGDLALARIDYAASLNPIDGRYWNHRGRIYRTMGDVASTEQWQRWALENARLSYREAIARDPYSPRHYVERARALVALGDSSAAHTCLLRAVEIEPNYLPARHGLGRLYAQSGDREGAMQQYREILDRKARYGNLSVMPFERGFLDVNVEQIRHELALLSAS